MAEFSWCLSNLYCINIEVYSRTESIFSYHQITQSSVRLISCVPGGLADEWHHPEGKNISLACCNVNQVVVAAGSELFYFEIENGKVAQKR